MGSRTSRGVTRADIMTRASQPADTFERIAGCEVGPGPVDAVPQNMDISYAK
jgi:hypothetical protein